MSDDAYTQKVQILGKTYLLKVDPNSCENCAFFASSSKFCTLTIRPLVVHLSKNQERGGCSIDDYILGCSIDDYILVEDTPKAIMQYLENILNYVEGEEDNE